MFELLSQFIEKECCPGYIDWYYQDEIYPGQKIVLDGEEKWIRDEMQDLYEWWHKVYNKEYEEVNDILWKEIESHPHGVNLIKYPFTDGFWGFETEEGRRVFRTNMEAIKKLEEKMEKDLDNNLYRLLNIRNYMWT